jgi:predicted TIM-barrel fold metal-dependent hydrolase
MTIQKDKPWDFVLGRGKKQGEEIVLKFPLRDDLTSIEKRFKGKRKQGIDLQILSIVPGMTYCSLFADLNKEVSSAINESLLSLVKEFPDKFQCMAQLPMQDPLEATKKFERTVKAGHLGA